MNSINTDVRMIKDLPKVSVAMPVYNSEKYLKEAIESILSQTYAHWELIIVNDASSDGSKEIIHSYADPRIRYFENEVNLGIARTRNLCVHYSNGKYIAVLDNDDIAMPTRLESQVSFLEANTPYGVCGSFYEIIDDSGKMVTRMKSPVSDTEIRTYLLFDNCFCNSTVMIRSELLKERKYEEAFDMIEDYYFLYTISKLRKLFILPAYMTQYRVHGKNTSIEKLDAMRSLHAKMDKMILADLQIPCNDQEFCLHTNFVTGNLQYFRSGELIRQLELWLIKFYRYLKSMPEYDATLVKRIFIRRWILLFRRNGIISRKMLFNHLFFKFHLFYIWIFLKLLVEKYSMVRSKA